MELYAHPSVWSISGDHAFRLLFRPRALEIRSVFLMFYLTAYIYVNV